MNATSTDRSGHYYIAPATAPTDCYAAGYEGNDFSTEAEAEAMIPSLRALGDDFDCEWVVSRYEVQS